MWAPLGPLKLAITHVHVVHVRVCTLCQWRVIGNPGCCLLRYSVVIETILSHRFRGDAVVSGEHVHLGISLFLIAVDISVHGSEMSATLQVLERVTAEERQPPGRLH